MSTGHAYLFNALFYLPAAVGILSIKTSGAPDGRRGTFSLASILGGVRFLFSQPVLVALVLLDFLVTGVGYYRPLLPIFAKDILHVGPAGFGTLSSAPAIGGVTGTLLLLVVGDFERKGLLVLWSLFSYAVAVGFLAISTNFWLSLSLLGFLGLANSLQAVMRQTTFHLLTPDHLRGRAFSVFNMFSQGANSVGATEVGFVAALIGAPGSMLFGCAVGAILTLGCWAAIPGLRRFGTDGMRSA
jgi:predicted MFS family arabinose efflux permease